MPFDVIYADPPWKCANRRTGGSHTSGSAQKYPVMPLPAIQQLPVQTVAAYNAALFLWVPSRLKFSHGQTTAVAWGFPDYRATIYWQKVYKGRQLGMGFWYRGMVEELLVFTRGIVSPFGCQRPNIITAPVEEHSRKPVEFHRLIEESTAKLGSRRRLELFAQRIQPGWRCVGQLVTGQDIRADLRGLATGGTP